MIDIIIGNICSLCAMVSDTISATRKKKNEILAVQIISQVFYGVGTLVLKGYSGVVQNAVAILRNLTAIRNINNKLVEWTLVILGVLLGVVFNNRGLLGLLPVVANLGYSIAVFQCKNNEKVLKLVFIASSLMFSVFSYAIQNYVGVTGNTIVAISAAISMIKANRGNLFFPRKTEESGIPVR